MMPQAHILITGRDQHLLETRCRVLQSVGHRVTTTLSPIRLSSNLEDVQLLIVCHTLSKAERERDLSTIADSYPKLNVLCLAPTPTPLGNGVSTLDSFSGTRELLRVVNQMLLPRPTRVDAAP